MMEKKTIIIILAVILLILIIGGVYLYFSKVNTKKQNFIRDMNNTTRGPNGQMGSNESFNRGNRSAVTPSMNGTRPDMGGTMPPLNGTAPAGGVPPEMPSE